MDVYLKMKILGILILCSFGEIFGWGRGDLEKYGPFQLALYSVKCDHDRLLDLDVSGVDVYFYDFSKNEVKSHPIAEAAKKILALKNLNITKKLIVFVPGFKSQINKKTEDRVRDTFRNLPNSYLIILDHSMYTNNREGIKKSYERSVKYVHYIGKALAGMLTELTNGGFSPKQIHAIGHSLGSQMLGHTGEAYHNNTGIKLARITALDPAGPCFSNSLTQEQVRSGVAEYVEVYHCNAGGLGTTSVLGDIDFFANRKGEAQPDCKTPLLPGVFDSSKAATCNHKACVLLYTATVSNPDWFVARRCDAYRNFRNGSCSINDATVAGFWNPGTAKGVYYFSTEGYDIK